MGGSLRTSIQALLTGFNLDEILSPGLLNLISLVITIAIILLLIKIAFKFINGLTNRIFNAKETAEGNTQQDVRRFKTVRSLIQSILKYVIAFIAIMMVLSERGVNTAGLLASAGIAGVALGLGAQDLVKDVIAGTFVIFEDQYAVGDYVTIGDKTGTVEDIGLRTTKIRDIDGQVHIIPNRKVEIVTNYRSKAHRVSFDVSISYETDVDFAIKTLQKAFDDNRASMPNVLEGPTILGVSKLDESGVNLRVYAMAKPMEHWQTERDLNLFIKKVLDENGIEIPYPHRSVIIENKVG